MDFKNWPLISYTNAVWTDIVPERAVIQTLVFCNTSGATVDIDIRISDGSNNKVSTLVTSYPLGAGLTETLDLPRSISVTGTQTLQVQASAAGVEFTAFGVV